MDGQNRLQEKKKSIWISLTGYRTLYVLKLLIEESRSPEELIEILKCNPYTKKSLSKDTIRLTINTLKKAGCEISRLNKSTNYKYVLYSHPFVLNFSNDELNSLLNLRKNASEKLSWQKILILNSFFEKIIKLSMDENKIDYVNSTAFFADVDKDVLKQLSNPNLYGKKVQIKYLSPKQGEEIIDIVVGEISSSQGKMYLSCYNYKYNANSILNVERIREIKTIYLTNEVEYEDFYEVEYELFGDSLASYKKENYETIIEKNSDSIKVKAQVYNEFFFIQRLLLFGADFKIISPDSFREKIINKIKSIRKRYQNEKIW